MAPSELAADPTGGASRRTPGERGRLSREQVAEVQRARVMRAAARVVAEHGFSGTSITQVAKAAGVSRVTFYDLFENFEQCFLAVLDAAMRRTSARIARAFAQNTTWQKQAVAGLAVLLSALDADPYLARVCLVEALAAGPTALEYHVREIELLKHMVDSAAGSARTDRHSSALSAEATVVAVAGILHRRLVTGEAPPFIDLLAPLTSLVLEPYFDEQTVTQAHERAERLAQELAKEHAARRARPATDTTIPKGLTNPRAHRGRACLRYLASHPGASNRAVGEGIGLTRLEQAAALLARLANQGLLHKQAGRPGHPNAWSLTPHGEQVARALEATDLRSRQACGHNSADIRQFRLVPIF
jgi:AcrR family transcriptional regulator